MPACPGATGLILSLCSRPTSYDQVKTAYVITPNMMMAAKTRMIVMHPLPRVDEIRWVPSALWVRVPRPVRLTAPGVPFALSFLIVPSLTLIRGRPTFGKWSTVSTCAWRCLPWSWDDSRRLRPQRTLPV